VTSSGGGNEPMRASARKGASSLRKGTDLRSE
jgi:hypothetical protein